MPNNSKSKRPTSWRDVIDVHPAAELFPRMAELELRELGNDIRERGLVSPVAIFREVDTNGVRYSLLDGINRLDAMEMAGIKFEFRFSKNGELVIKSSELSNTDGDVARCRYVCDDPFDFVLSANVHRRHLTIEQKDDLIAKLLKAQPEKSNRQLAKMVGVSHPHLAAVRAKLEKSGDVETVTTSIDTRGRKQPAKKKRRDVDDYLAEKRVRLAAKDTEAPGPAPQPTDTITLNEQLMALSLKLEKFGDGYSARVREWCAAHPKMPDQFRRALSGILENFCFRMQMLVQDIDGRNPDDHDEAASAPAGPPVGDDLDIPPCLKRT